MNDNLNLLENIVIEYINNQVTIGALQIDGPWGSGKTHYMKNVIIPCIEKNELEREKDGFYSKRIPLLISLFGLKSIDEISRQLLFASTHRRYGLSKKRIEDLKTVACKVAKLIPYVKKFDWEKAFQTSPSTCLKLLGKDVIIILDDLERVSEDIKTEDILGFVNDLIENYNFKVILISNQSKLKERDIDKVNQFKEKVVEKTIPFEIATFPIIKIIAKGYNSLLPLFLESKEIKCYLDNRTNERVNNNQLSNLRIIRFALSQFAPIFKYFINEKEYNNIPQNTLKKLYVIWRFTLAISIEYRLGHISLEKENDLENAGMHFRFAHLILEGKIKDDNAKTFEDDFIERYYERFGLSYLYISEIYNYILKGGDLDFKSIDEKVSKNLGIWEDNSQSEEISFVNNFIGSIHFFSDDEAPTKFLKYLDLISLGYVLNISDLINAASVIISYKDITNLTDEEIISKINDGIDIFFSKIDDDSLDKLKLELDRFSINSNPNSKQCLAYALNKIETRKEQLKLQYIDSLNEWFRKDIKNFAKEFIPYQVAPNVYGSFSPILHLLNLELVERRIHTLLPWECEELRNMLYYRFGEKSMSEYSIEKPFIEAIKKGLDAIEDGDIRLSTHFKRSYLIPIVNRLLGE